MGLELSTALPVETGVVVGNAALPMVGLLPGVQFDGPVEIGDGGLDLAQLEVLASSTVVDLRRLGIELDHDIVVGNGLAVTPLHLVQPPAEIKALRVLRVAFDGSIGQGESLGQVAALIGATRLRQQVAHGHLLGHENAPQNRKGRDDAQGPKPLQAQPSLVLRRDASRPNGRSNTHTDPPQVGTRLV